MRTLRFPILPVALGITLVGAGTLGACGSSTDSGTSNNFSTTNGKSSSTGKGAGSGGAGGEGMGGSLGIGGSITGPAVGSGGNGGGQTQGFDVQPSMLQTITVTSGAAPPTVDFKATLNGSPINAAWGVDRGDIGTIPAAAASTATFTPTGKTGGTVNILAGLNGTTIKRQVFVKLSAQQNGADPTNPDEAKQIAGSYADLLTGGGIGGVGGEGLGPGVTDASTLTALGAPTGDAAGQKLAFLYPYDKTVFPRGLLAPLIQWSWTTGDADAIKMTLTTTSGSFSWSGTFARPAVLAQSGGAKFIRHPIPQDVWASATNSASGADQLTLSLTVASGGVAYGPITQTWTIAPARLAGTVYYNSYGTALVKNSTDFDKNNQQYGAAVLSIKSGDTGPSVVSGPASGTSGTGCRVCHVVASNGSRLIVQEGDVYARTKSVDLQNANAETTLSGYDNLFGWAGLSPDGTLAFTNTADLAASAPASRLYTFPPTSTTALGVTGIPANLQAGTPTFSPDTAHVAFDFIGGTIGTTTGNGTQLVAMDFDKTSLTFSNLRVLATAPGGQRSGFPSFFPTSDAVAFHRQIVTSSHRYNTWQGATAQVWWSDLATGNAVPLGILNGMDGQGGTYLPKATNNHMDDTVLNYEPTVNPVASGGYVWVVFTSRRLYGNMATTDPWQSDPRNYNQHDYTQVTTKKLWVAAVDLNAPAGSDPSHPAFYLPAQELSAGNARGFWVLDPCKADGSTCESGDQCCGGFCEPNASGQLQCNNTNPNSSCSQLQEKCTTAADCCDGTNVCVNGFCSLKGIN